MDQQNEKKAGLKITQTMGAPLFGCIATFPPPPSHPPSFKTCRYAWVPFQFLLTHSLSNSATPRPTPPTAATRVPAEFMPYVFQLYALLLDVRPAPLPDFYVGLLRPLLDATLWSRTANVPALTRLLRTYIKKVSGRRCADGSGGGGVRLEANTRSTSFWDTVCARNGWFTAH